MSNEQPSRPPRRSGSGASPMGSTLAIVIAIAAVVVGFLILKNIRSDDDDNTSATTTSPTSSTLDPLTSPHHPAADRTASHGLHADDDGRHRAGRQLVAPERCRQDTQHRVAGQSVHDGRADERRDQGSCHQDPVRRRRRRGRGGCSIGRGSDGCCDGRDHADARLVAGSHVARRRHGARPAGRRQGRQDVGPDDRAC